MAGNPLSLRNLTRFDFSAEKMAAFNAEWDAMEQSYKDRYGEKWQEMMDADFEKRNSMIHRMFINTRIYEIGHLSLFPAERHSDEDLAEFDARLHEVYGDQYDELVASRTRCDPRVGELLIQEALRTGDWEALPEALQHEYHKRAGDIG